MPVAEPTLIAAPSVARPTLPKTGSSAPAPSVAVAIGLVAIGLVLSRLRNAHANRGSR
jgi:LPXTG-motif cell wall-anchored protein